MSADDHDLVGELTSLDDAEGVEDVLEWTGRGVAAHEYARAHGAGADVIAERKTALPRLRDARAAHALEQRGRVLVRRRHHRDVRHLHLAQRNPLRARMTRITGRARVTVVVHHAAALHAGLGAHRAFGIDVAAHVAVVGGIAVDDECDRAALLGLARLDAAIRVAVARDRDLALHGNAHRIELLVVLDQSIVHVDDGCAHIAGAAVAVGDDLLECRPGSRIAGHCALGQLERERVGRHAPKLDLGGVRHPHVVRSHFGLQPPRLHRVDHVVARVLLRGRARDVRLLRELVRVMTRAPRVRARGDARLEVALGARGSGRVAGSGRSLRAERGGREQQCDWERPTHHHDLGSGFVVASRTAPVRRLSNCSAVRSGAA